MTAQDLIGNPPPKIPPLPPEAPPVLTFEPVVRSAPKVEAPKRKPAVMPAPVAAPAPSIADDMAALQERLARSLNVEPSASGSYDAMAFVTALEAVHDRFVKARASLSEWEASLEAKEQSILSREKALKDAETRAAAALRLAKLMPDEAPKKRWFQR